MRRMRSGSGGWVAVTAPSQLLMPWLKNMWLTSLARGLVTVEP